MAAGIGALFCVIFMVKGSQREPTRLRLGAAPPKGDQVRAVIDPKKSPQFNSRPAPSPRTRSAQDSIDPATIEVVQSEVRIKSINVIFNYNGHSWDAHEVLGIPAGAPLPMVKEAFERAMKNSEPASHEFTRAAYQAITKLKSV